MTPVLVFFGIAALVGLLLRGILGARLRAATQRASVTEDELCSLRQANRISSTAVVVSVAGAALVGLALVLSST